jgi:hypothetical protein
VSTLEGLYSNIRRATLEEHFDVTIERAEGKACNTTWNLSSKPAFALEQGREPAAL